MLDWDDLRYVLAIARTGVLAGAGTALGVNHSTMFRRLNALEETLGVQLFERLPGGYVATEAGERLIGAAERVEAEVLAAEREITGRDTRLCGRLRVTCSETLAFRLLTAEIARFRGLHPGIQIELVIDNRQLDLARREADVACARPGRARATCSGANSPTSPGRSTPRPATWPSTARLPRQPIWRATP
jgi:DNA-binding transcriptional LysR family regulator